MYIEDIDEAATLRNHRQKAIDLREAARSGSIGDLNIFHEGNKLMAWNLISAEPVREAIMKACSDFIAEKDRALAALGVNTAPKLVRVSEHPTPMTTAEREE